MAALSLNITPLEETGCLNNFKKKNHFKTYISKIHFKIAPSKKNAFQNCYLSSLVTEGIRTLLFFSQKILKGKHKSNF